MSKVAKPDYDRGKIVALKLRKTLTLNRNQINLAIIEIDHINYGLNKRTKKLNKTSRTNFTARDIEKFLMLLNDEEIAAESYKGLISKFAIKINCPVIGQFYGKPFILIFDLDYSKSSEIHTITLYPGW